MLNKHFGIHNFDFILWIRIRHMDDVKKITDNYASDERIYLCIVVRLILIAL